MNTNITPHTHSAAAILETVDEFVASRFSTWQSWRRHLHQYPEQAWAEVETTKFLRERLSECGLELSPGPRDLGGVVNIQHGDVSRLKDQNWFAIRGDIDAIQVSEANDVEYRSQVDGLMHACGHDVHATTILAVCETLQYLSKELSIDLPFLFRGLFQPAEESAQGAHEMIQNGALVNVDNILGIHVDPNFEYGIIGLRDGLQTARCDEINVTCTGSAGHGARPYETNDPILAATQFIAAAYAMVPRVVDVRKELVLSFCEIKGGNSSNVIPVEVTIRGTMRSFDPATSDNTFERLKLLAQNMGEGFRVHIDVKRGISVPSVDNDSDMNQLVREAAGTLVLPESVVKVDKSLGGEDFAFYQQKIPGSLVRMGSSLKGRESTHLHAPNFDVDEQVIALSCRLFVRSVLKWFSRKDTQVKH